MTEQATEARYTTIDGVRAKVEVRHPPLPRRLDELFSRLQQVTLRRNITPAGARALCTERQEHAFVAIRVGRMVCLDGIVRDLRVEMCSFCGAACVRDISVDRIDGLPTGRKAPARRDLVLGWYSGARPGRREYR